MQIVFPCSRGKKREEELAQFAAVLKQMQREMGDFKVSSRGWCYLLEPLGLSKGDFDRIQRIINEMRKRGYLSIDFTAQDTSRKWYGVEIPDSESPTEYLAGFLKGAQQSWKYYTPNWWEGETYYIQMLVEKIDLKTLFQPICDEYHIPIATAKGWSDINQRAEMAWRFKKAEEKGLHPLLLYCGDFDVFGVIIGKTLKQNLFDIAGGTGWLPVRLSFRRFGLNQDFIEENNLSWIENLETASGKNLADPGHPQHYLPEVQDWLRRIGERKVEANALVRAPEAGRELCRQSIERYLGEEALERFQAKRDAVKAKMDALDAETGVLEAIQQALDLIEG